LRRSDEAGVSGLLENTHLNLHHHPVLSAGKYKQAEDIAYKELAEIRGWFQTIKRAEKLRGFISSSFLSRTQPHTLRICIICAA
jgi:hypothetical protein